MLVCYATIYLDETPIIHGICLLGALRNAVRFRKYQVSWRRHGVEALSALLTLCMGKSTGDLWFTSERTTNAELCFVFQKKISNNQLEIWDNATLKTDCDELCVLFSRRRYRTISLRSETMRRLRLTAMLRRKYQVSWRRHGVEALSALLTLCMGKAVFCFPEEDFEQSAWDLRQCNA